MNTTGLDTPEAKIRLPVKDRFFRAREVAYLDTAAEGLPPPDTAAEPLSRYFRDKSVGTPGRRVLRAKMGAARSAPTKAEEIGILSCGWPWTIPTGKTAACKRFRDRTPAYN